MGLIPSQGTKIPKLSSVPSLLYIYIYINIYIYIPPLYKVYKEPAVKSISLVFISFRVCFVIICDKFVTYTTDFSFVQNACLQSAGFLLLYYSHKREPALFKILSVWDPSEEKSRTVI